MSKLKNQVVEFNSEEEVFAYYQKHPEEIDALMQEIRARMQDRYDTYFQRSQGHGFWGVWEAYGKAVDTIINPQQVESVNYEECANRITEDSWYDVGDQLRLAILKQLKEQSQAA